MYTEINLVLPVSPETVSTWSLENQIQPSVKLLLILQVGFRVHGLSMSLSDNGCVKHTDEEYAEVLQ